MGASKNDKQVELEKKNVPEKPPVKP